MLAVVCTVIMPCGYGHSQDVSSTIMRMRESYQRSDNLQRELIYYYYPSYTSLMPQDSLEGLFVKWHGKQYYRLSEQENLVTKDFCIVVDHVQKCIIKSDPLDFSSDALMLLNPDSVINRYSKASILFDSPDRVKIRFDINKDKSPEVDAIALSIDKRSYMADSVFMFYKNTLNDNDNFVESSTLPLIILVMPGTSISGKEIMRITDIKTYLKPPEYNTLSDRFKGYRFIDYTGKR